MFAFSSSSAGRARAAGFSETPPPKFAIGAPNAAAAAENLGVGCEFVDFKAESKFCAIPRELFFNLQTPGLVTTDDLRRSVHQRVCEFASYF